MRDLAWELATATRPHLKRFEADPIFVAIGAGDTFGAIDKLITVLARDRIALRDDLVAAVAAWLDGYRGQTVEPRLRERLAEIERHSPPCDSAVQDRFGAALARSREQLFGALPPGRAELPDSCFDLLG